MPRVAVNGVSLHYEEAGVMTRAIPGAQIWRVPNATHFINLDEPELFNTTVLEFLAR